MIDRLVVNGRFLDRPISGVERLATELLIGLTELADQLGLPTGTIDVVVPSPAAEWRVADLPTATPPPAILATGRHGHAWEQLTLPARARGAWLLSPCNVGPLARARQALVICDAQARQYPASYSRAFRWLYGVLQPLLARRVALVLTISQYSRRQLEHYRIVPRGKASVIRLGVDHVHRWNADADTLTRHGIVGTPYLLALGSLAPHKNLALLTRAFLAADLVDVVLVVAGGGNGRIFADAGLVQHPRIRYIGKVNDGELKALYQGALGFACPSVTEGFGLPPLEAMACGCAVAATTGGAVPEICADAAIYADPDDEQAWTTAITKLATDVTVRDGLRHRGVEHAARFTWRLAALDVLRAMARHDDDKAMLDQLAHVEAQIATTCN